MITLDRVKKALVATAVCLASTAFGHNGDHDPCVCFDEVVDVPASNGICPSGHTLADDGRCYAVDSNQCGWAGDGYLHRHVGDANGDGEPNDADSCASASRQSSPVSASRQSSPVSASRQSSPVSASRQSSPVSASRQSSSGSASRQSSVSASRVGPVCVNEDEVAAIEANPSWLDISGNGEGLCVDLGRPDDERPELSVSDGTVLMVTASEDYDICVWDLADTTDEQYLQDCNTHRYQAHCFSQRPGSQPDAVRMLVPGPGYMACVTPYSKASGEWTLSVRSGGGT